MKIKFSVNAKAIGRELLGLLVEDFSFAFALTAWIVIVVFAVPRMGLTSASRAPQSHGCNSSRRSD